VTKETKTAKALRYLASGRVSVQRHDTMVSEVHVTGDAGGEPYHVIRRAAEWSCDCPAQVECAHILACKAIIATPPGEDIRLWQASPDELDALLDG
jgi:hypothetical protein